MIECLIVFIVKLVETIANFYPLSLILSNSAIKTICFKTKSKLTELSMVAKSSICSQITNTVVAFILIVYSIFLNVLL